MNYSTLTLLLPEMVKGINNNMMYIFGAVNVVSIPIGELSFSWSTTFHALTKNIITVWALYPESNQRSLEEMDFLFSSPKPWAWEAEKAFKLRKEESPDIVRRSSIVSMTSRRHSNSSLQEKGSVHLDNIGGPKM
jgi:hypothetical protein